VLVTCHTYVICTVLNIPAGLGIMAKPMIRFTIASNLFIALSFVCGLNDAE